MKKIILLFCFLLSGCSPPLTVYTRYETRGRLASTHVRTPDPRLKSSDSLGQTLIISWDLPEALLRKDPLLIRLEVVYQSHKREIFQFPVLSKVGTREIGIKGEKYLSTKGILSFQAFLIQKGEVIETSRHPLFVNELPLSQVKKGEGVNPLSLE